MVDVSGADEIRVDVADEHDVDACEAILRNLPDWFGIEESIVEYVEDVRSMHTLVVRANGGVAGFLTLHEHNPSTSEIHIMAVDSRYQRRGIGRALVSEAVNVAMDRGNALLEVKTLGPSHPDRFYARTRRFYEAMGFMPVEEIHDLWPGNPCLIMVKVLGT